jgi:hypothetical protein
MAGRAGVGNQRALHLQRQTASFAKSSNSLGKLAKAGLLYYNISMSDHLSHHHHHAGHAHPPATVHPSILRMSVLERLAASVAVIALIWLAAYWAMR